MSRGVFEVVALVGIMGALFSVARRGNKLPLLHFSDTPVSVQIRQSDGSTNAESLKRLVETKSATVV
jgi:hypothetical protein